MSEISLSLNRASRSSAFRVTQMVEWLRATSPLTVFLASYALTAVLGNLVYLTPAGSDLPGMSIPGWTGSFPMHLGAEFWLLVLLPFIVAAPAALAVARLARRPAAWMGRIVPEIPPVPYTLLCAVLYAYVLVSLMRAGAISSLLTPSTGVAAVEARFTLLSHLSFSATTSLKSLLVFLSVYSIVRANRDGTVFWTVAAIVNFVAMICCLTLLSMKWPAVLFVFTAAVAMFVTGRRHFILSAAAVGLLGVVIYFILATVILHLSDEPARTAPRAPVSTAQRVGVTAAKASPKLAQMAMNRMAIALPYYYAYHADHPECPQSLSLLYPKRPLACEPTLLVYEDLFGLDGFQGGGTAPAAVQMYAYALSGWMGAIAALLLASGVIGLFIALWRSAKANSIYAAALIMGAYTAYGFSQLPIEGPLIYDHGMWWVLMVFGWMAVYWPIAGLRHGLRRG